MASPYLEENISSKDRGRDVGNGVRPSFSNRLRSSLSNAWTSFRGAFTWRSRRRGFYEMSDPLGRSRRSPSPIYAGFYERRSPFDERRSRRSRRSPSPIYAGRSRRSPFDETFDEMSDPLAFDETFDETFDEMSDPLVYDAESLGLKKTYRERTRSQETYRERTRSQESASSSSSPSPRSDATSQYITLDVDGGFHDISEFGVVIHCPPNTVAHPTKVTFKKHPSVHFRPAPAGENETLVSYIVELAPRSLLLQEPIAVSLMHSGAGKTEGYETIMKEFDDDEHKWKQIKEIQGHYFPPEHCKTDYIQVKISKPTTLAVVSRLIADGFQVTEKGCIVRSSVCNDVIVEFPEGAVDKTVNGTMKLLPMPVNIKIGTTSYPGPILLIDGFQGVCFKHNVKIRVPHPYPAGYSMGKIKLFCKEDTKQTSHEWKDITDQVQYFEDELFIELQVDHFSWLWTWIYDVPLTYLSSWSQYLFIAPQTVRFAAFKNAEECSSETLTITLVCIPNHEPIERTAAMKGYATLAMSTASKKMRPDDKAYIKVEGSYRKIKKEFFLQFIRNEMCIKELNLKRKSNRKRNRSKSDGKLVIYFLEKENIDKEDNLCEFRIYPKKITLNESEGESCSEEQDIADTVKALALTDNLSVSADMIGNIDATRFAKDIARQLNLDKLSVKDPPEEIVESCRKLCIFIKKKGRRDIIKKLREELPSGMTGPLLFEECDLVRNILWKIEDLTLSLKGNETWKKLANQLGMKGSLIESFADEKNPAKSVLEKVCKKRKLKVKDLYEKLCQCGANAFADEYL